MRKSQILAAAAVLALSAGYATAAGPGVSAAQSGQKSKAQKVSVGPEAVLYNQNDNDVGNAFTSQNFESSFDAYDAQGADGFSVPKGVSWKVTNVVVTGVYYNGAGLAVSENVTFYKDAGGRPGAVVKAYPAVVGTDNGTGSFDIKLPKALKLKKGKYHVSVQVNMDFALGGQWGWEGRSVIAGGDASWQNPGDGFATGCVAWDSIVTCIAGGPDLMFSLSGKAK
jgi:hypothetical protein